MAKYIISENVVHYHEVEIDDELDILDIVNQASELAGNRYTGYEALEELLSRYQEKFGFEYSVKPNYCGTICEHMEVEDC